jgi:lactate dehydrogenase-like 2-hydroxyacid dehydrogenase
MEDPEKKLKEVSENITGVISTAWFGVSAKVIKALPNLEIISHFGVGYDNVDVQAAKKRGIIVTNTPDVLTDDTADVGMALVLAVFRRTVEGDIYVRTGQWAKKGPLPMGRGLRGKKMGIVGLGRIGSAIARRAEAFGIEVSYHGPKKKRGVAYPYVASLEALAKALDILMIACPYNAETHHLINAKVLKALGKKGVLINIARGKIVDEKALIDALENGIISGAGLDVFENEPDVPSALCRLDNVVLQPHVGSATAETRAAMAQLVVDNLRLYFEKAEVLTPV